VYARPQAFFYLETLHVRKDLDKDENRFVRTIAKLRGLFQPFSDHEETASTVDFPPRFDVLSRDLKKRDQNRSFLSQPKVGHRVFCLLLFLSLRDDLPPQACCETRELPYDDFW